MKLFGRKKKKDEELTPEEIEKKRKKEEKEKDLKQEQKEHNKSVAKATAGVTLVSISDQAMNAAPILALTGIGLPLAAGLYVVGQLANTSAQKSVLNRMVEDSKYIMGSSYAQYTAMLKTVEYYVEVVSEINSKVKSKTVKEVEKYVMEKGLGKGILKKIVRKLELITGLLSEVEKDPNKKASRLGKIKRAMNRNLYGNYYINELTRELTVFQGLFSTLNTKFQMLRMSYNTRLNMLKNRKIITDDDIDDIKSEVDNLFSQFVSMDIEDILVQNTNQLKENDLMNNVYDYVKNSEEVAQKYINEKNDARDDKSGGKNKTKKKKNIIMLTTIHGRTRKRR